MKQNNIPLLVIPLTQSPESICTEGYHPTEDRQTAGSSCRQVALVANRFIPPLGRDVSVEVNVRCGK